MENIRKLWEELSKLDQEEFLDKSDYEDFNYYLSDPCGVLMEMANLRGNDVLLEKHLPFSFYFSSKSKVHNRHAIRAKILWNPSKAPADADGYMELHGEYEYVLGSHKYKPTAKELKIARDFFKKYKVLFAAVWEEKLDDADVQHYLEGYINFKFLLTKFYNVSEKNFYNVNHCKNLNELEQCVRQNKIFSMND